MQQQNEQIRDNSINVEEHERILNEEMQRAEKAAHEKLAKIQEQMQAHMTKVFEERITDSHTQMQQQLDEATSRLAHENQLKLEAH